MIALKFKNTATRTYAIPEVWVKTISAAWDQIRLWRDTIPYEALEGAVLTVTDENGPIVSDRIPAEIIFKANKNGKLEFRNLKKVRTVKKVESSINEDEEDYPDQGEEFLNRDLAWSML